MSKKLCILISLALVLSQASISYGAPGNIRLDFDDRSDVNTQPGFTSFLLTDSGSTVNGITIELAGNIDDCRRANPYDEEFPIPYTEIYRDFIFGIQPSGVTITLWGLGANQQCSLVLYCYDAQSEPTRAADWYSNGGFIFTADFNGGAINWPEDITDYNNTATVTADQYGRIELMSTRNEASPEGLDFAFVNALLVSPQGMYIQPDYASNPQPADGTEDIAPTAIVSWTQGARSEQRDVYMGTSFNNVSTASRGTPKGVLLSTGQPGNTFNYGGAAGRLKLDTEYFWRVDEVNTAPPPTTFWVGEVWSFTTLPYAVVEDFDSYADTAALKTVWEDSNTNGNSSTVSLETVIAHDGNSMKVVITNANSPYYAEAEATMADLVMDPNWLGMGAKALSLWFRGTSGNDANEQMYIELTDNSTNSAKVFYDGSPFDIKYPEWHEWNIDLQEFIDDNPSFDLRNVAKIIIGFGDGVESVGSGTGTVYFDDIRLYATRCVLAKRDSSGYPINFARVDYAPLGPLWGDCIINYKELEIMANDWLWFYEEPNRIPPLPGYLVAYYPMNETDGNLVFAHLEDNDACDPCYTGTFSPAGVSRVIHGIYSDGALHFDGNIATRVSCGNENPASEANELTLAVWVKWLGPRVWDSYLEGKSQGLIGKRTGWNSSDTGLMFQFECDTTPGPRGSFALRTFDRAVYSPANILNPFIGRWIHLAATYDGTTSATACKLYLNGNEVAHGSFGFGANFNAGLTIGNNNDETGWPAGPEAFWGDIDEVHIYKRALTTEEIAYLAGPGDITEIEWAIISRPADLYPDRKINFKDFAILANYWLEEDMFP